MLRFIEDRKRAQNFWRQSFPDNQNMNHVYSNLEFFGFKWKTSYAQFLIWESWKLEKCVNTGYNPGGYLSGMFLNKKVTWLYKNLIFFKAIVNWQNISLLYVCSTKWINFMRLIHGWDNWVFSTLCQRLLFEPRQKAITSRQWRCLQFPFSISPKISTTIM